MTSASALTDCIALFLFQDIREGMQNGRIADLNTAQTEVDAAIAKLNSRRLPEEHTLLNDLIGKLLLEIGSLHEKVTKCEAQLTDFQLQAKVLKEDTTQIVARTEACGLLVEQQQKENAKVLATMEEMKASVSTASPPCIAPVPSPTDPISRPALSRVAVVSFPGGPRTVTIHPPDSPSYQSIIRDEKGDVIIDFRRTKPLRREGAFRGPLEDIDWFEIARVCGRGPEQPGARAVLPGPRWPDRSQPSLLPPSRGPSDLIARQRQLLTSMQTDPFGRVLAPEYLSNAKSPSLPTGMPSSSLAPSSQDSQSSSSAKLDRLSTSPSTLPSPSDGRGKKRTRNSEDDEGVPVTSETAHEEASLLTADPRTIKEPTTPTPVKREESHPPEGPAKRKKLRLSASLEGLSTASGSLSCTPNLLELTRTV